MSAAGSPEPRPRRSAGFTLLELLVVVVIVALASAGVTLSLRDASQVQLEREALAATLRELEKSLRKSESVAFQRVTELDLFHTVVELKLEDATCALTDKVAILEADLAIERERRAGVKKLLIELADGAEEKLRKRLLAEAEILG